MATTQKRARYNLRTPFSASMSTAEEDALLEVIQRGKIDEVTFFVPHGESKSLGLGTLEDSQACADRLAPIFERLAREGIDASINVWWTLSFSNFPGLKRDQRDQYDFRWAVGVTGTQSTVVACPQDEAWRNHTRQMYGIYAGVKPRRLWIDDDVHMTLKGELHSPCVCDVCLAAMATRTGRSISREELVPAIMADPPNPVRNAWLDFQEEICYEIIEGLATAVHEVSPATHMGLMFSHLEVHSAEGRKWDRIVEALGEPTPYFRPSIGPYNEGAAVSYAEPMSWCRLSRAALPGHVHMAPEIENYPQSRFFKSTRGAMCSVVHGQLLGITDSALNLYRGEGCFDRDGVENEPWSTVLSNTKPFLQGIGDLGIERDQFQGVSLHYHEDVCRHTHGVADEPKPILMYRRRALDQTLPLMGIATRYGIGDLTVFAGESIACLSDEERREVFSRGVLLDGRAAETLLMGGNGELAGIAGQLGEVPSTHETVEDGAFGKWAGDSLNNRWDGLARQFEWLDGARVISTLRGYDGGPTGHGLVLFENELGGRVVVLPYDSQNELSTLGTYQAMCSPGFITFSRQAQIKAGLEWAKRGPLELFVPNAPSVYPMLMRQDKRLIVSVMNLLPDPVENLTLELGAPGLDVAAVQVLQKDGVRAKLPDATIEPADEQGRIVVRTSVTIPYLDTAVLVLE